MRPVLAAWTIASDVQRLDRGEIEYGRPDTVIFGQLFAGLHRFVNRRTIGEYGRLVTMPEPVGPGG